MPSRKIQGQNDTTQKQQARACAKLPRTTHAGKLQIGTVEIPCYIVPHAGRALRLVSVRGTTKALNMGSSSSGPKLARFAGQNSLKPNISDDLLVALNSPIKFGIGHGKPAHGYEVTVLADICNAVVDAHLDGRLRKDQEHIVRRCMRLLQGTSKVGWVALVDEATGYQEERDRHELHKLLALYISPELMPWTKRFKDGFWQQLARLRGWDFRSDHKRPRYAGKLVNLIIYDRMPPEVVSKLRELNPADHASNRKGKHHQWLTDQYGVVELEKRIYLAASLMKVSHDWSEFLRLLQRIDPSPNSQLLLALGEDFLLGDTEE